MRRLLVAADQQGLHTGATEAPFANAHALSLIRVVDGAKQGVCMHSNT
jgi:hypothetical protein